MTVPVDQTIATLRAFDAFAANQGATVERVEVTLRRIGDSDHVQFTAHLAPLPLECSTAALSYVVPISPAAK